MGKISLIFLSTLLAILFIALPFFNSEENEPTILKRSKETKEIDQEIDPERIKFEMQLMETIKARVASGGGTYEERIAFGEEPNDQDIIK